ncbi:transcriptional regulator, MarR family [Thermoanaerobacter thermohydrosulfuricus]|uniref:Transcriptional regulator, MarR family n=1 Tax=Thermoanaerobacter thermohydrosulfuricus TaxID=1516 RepID=A0A1I2BEL0_THETY|nr:MULTISPECIES: MarR family transcriptional regulator [Thermoanaerobacter]SDG63274.1 transcriptional regulator, MarR family [Thermoanaerobacter thermohydrosulfuricus]SFE54499.1 transcriptional regulator, MarR family [Thermoanaerobacter thermohydrosulfuricus]
MKLGYIDNLEMFLREINHILNLYTRSYLNEKNITMARFWVMNKLSADNPITMKELQRRLLLAPGTLTGLVDNLVSDGLAERWRDETDRRLVYLKLTQEGDKLLKEILQYRTSILANILKKIDGLDVERLNRDLRLIWNQLKECETC